MKQLTIKIVTPERIVFEGEAESLSVMTETGEITLLPDHIPLVTSLRPGEMRLKQNGEENLMVVSTGFLEVRPGNQIVVLADTAERVEELELEKIEAAREEARKILSEKRAISDVSAAAATAALEREMARYRVAIKKRKIPRNPINN
ncbi:MAG: ATP synthase epsilon chain [Candidatus Uhrbacteria bacterium GW2011_GWE2_45_35]|uniref:ATP synthase epsilon chain n=2 Tax=Candidatus Uhriibacteriota TaxID=1752732 RepID=A0A0G1JF79_9BACT|nr:MAG: ATP synthase epsilon chain [Candidatus Uhrbacteria bacterium GW2011_GWF2_44_350]KKU06767.1 MAG: ATP synthase epsilon chain [Candidatus Uhrbacteria bacterium GW2011_GWE2_45_35]HBR80716.1 ATP synthase F1 subunit epsilon [Candidatus Uhrbacteria bacterium]HCU31348.1 ATP synthase F1 subunit epsilon [Candidatus Uhrbacteria bacterium]